MDRTIMIFNTSVNHKKIAIPSTFTIKTPVKNNVDLSKFFYESYHNTIDDEGENLQDWNNELSEVFNSKYGHIIKQLSFSLYKDKQLIGCLLSSQFKGITLILYVVIHPNYGGQGLAKFLLSKVIENGKQLNTSKIYLVVTNENTSAHTLYKSIGFEPTRKKWENILDKKYI